MMTTTDCQGAIHFRCGTRQKAGRNVPYCPNAAAL